MSDKIQERLPESSEIMNAIKTEIDIIHALCDESDAAFFRQDLATLLARWAVRLNDKKLNDKKGD